MHCLDYLLSIGINSIKAVQEERGPRKNKTATGLAKSRVVLNQHQMKSSLDYNQQKYTILVQILMSCINQARQNMHFQYLHKQEQNVILEVVWFECFLLRAACWTIDIVPIVESCMDHDLTLSIERIKSLGLDWTEIVFIETLILCRKELGMSKQSKKQLEIIHENALICLGRYTLNRGYPIQRYGKLISAVRDLVTNQRNGNIYVVFRSIIGNILGST